MKHLFVIGDSISCYYGKYLRDMLAGICGYDRKGSAHKLKDLDDGTDGINGGNSRMVIKYLRERTQRSGFAPDYLMINCGLHDIKKGAGGDCAVPAGEYADNLRTIVSLANGISCRMIWVRTTPVNPAFAGNVPAAIVRHAQDVLLYNRIADRVMREYGIPMIDLYTFTENLGPDIYLNGIDSVHFNETCAAQQAAFIAGWLQSYFNHVRKEQQ